VAQPELRVLEDAAAAVGLGRRTLERWLSEGKLTGYKIAGDRKRYIDMKQLARLRQPQALPKPRRRKKA